MVFMMAEIQVTLQGYTVLMSGKDEKQNVKVWMRRKKEKERKG